MGKVILGGKESKRDEERVGVTPWETLGVRRGGGKGGRVALQGGATGLVLYGREP